MSGDNCVEDKGFVNKVVLIVGGGSPDGIGFAAARKVAEKGASVAIADRTEAGEIVSQLPEASRHSSHAIDVTEPSSVTECIEAVIERHGRIDGAFVASGIYSQQTFLETSLDTWNDVIAVNLTGSFVVAQAVARAMRKGGGGRIVLVSSIAGRRPTLAGAAYGVSKAAVTLLGQYMALELAGDGICVNVLVPGSTLTSMMGQDPKRHSEAIQGTLEGWRLGIPLGRMALAEDQAEAVAFLLSDAARHITGQSIGVDGGQTFL